MQIKQPNDLAEFQTIAGIFTLGSAYKVRLQQVPDFNQPKKKKKKKSLTVLCRACIITTSNIKLSDTAKQQKNEHI